MFLSVKNNRRDVFILTYAMLVALAANALFLHGFFPVKYDDNPVATMSDVPDHVGHVRSVNIKSIVIHRFEIRNVLYSLFLFSKFLSHTFFTLCKF